MKANPLQKSTGSQKPGLPAKRGRPSGFDPLTTSRAIDLAREGLSLVQIAERLGIAQTTLSRRMVANDEFRIALNHSRAVADQAVESSLYQRACGFERNGIFYPPNVQAMQFWLKNRQPQEWGDTQRIETTSATTPPEALARIQQGLFEGFASYRDASGHAVSMTSDIAERIAEIVAQAALGGLTGEPVALGLGIARAEAIRQRMVAPRGFGDAADRTLPHHTSI